MAELVVKVFGRPERRCELSGESILIGAAPQCDVVVDSPFVSWDKVRLVLKGETHELVDDGSTNPVKVNGQKVERKRALASGDEISIGDVRLIYLQAGTRRRTRDFSDLQPSAALYVDISLREVWLNGAKLPLTLSEQEFHLLEFLYLNRDRVCSHAEIGERIWGTYDVGGVPQPSYTDNQLHRLVLRVRKKLEAFDTVSWILNVPGVGYRLADPMPSGT